MKIVDKGNHFLFKNERGEYHLDKDEFNRLGKEAAIKIAEKEINLKQESVFRSEFIDFKSARAMGFCEYGIKDFCEKVGLDINKKHTLDSVAKSLTIEALTEYQSEIKKLLGLSAFDKFGGVLGFCENEKVDHENRLGILLNFEVLKKENDVKLSGFCAMSVVDLYEKEFPNDNRIRIRAKQKSEGILDDAAWAEAWDADWAAARAADWAAAWAAARAAASDAAWDAARAAAWAEAWDADWAAARAEKYKLFLGEFVRLYKLQEGINDDK